MDKKQQIINLINELNAASLAYYQEAREIMSNFEYDEKYDELVKLEKETGIILDNSPTKNVGSEVISKLPKERHTSRMLSLNKTKSEDELKSFLGEKEGVLSWKLDGLTVVLTYDNGRLNKAVTRGNGEIGEIITENAKNFENVPVEIGFKGELVLRGEAVISYSDFEKINSEIEEKTAKYKNPRNLCSGSVRQLDSKITKKRHVKFFAFSLVSASEVDFKNSRMEEFAFLKNQGFDIVEHYKVDKKNIYDKIDYFRQKIKSMDIPSDGLVLTLEDLEYSKSLGVTAKFPRDSIAFKWKDEVAETVLLKIEWSPSRTGLINPVAIFEPVELEGTTVSRASVHNVSIVEELDLRIGDKISVYKANMIIPQVAENLSYRKRNDDEYSKKMQDKISANNGSKFDLQLFAEKELDPIIPENCPACGEKLVIKKEEDTKTLHCVNKDCPVKRLKSFSLLVSRDALNIEGLSEATLEKFLSKGFIKEYKDIYHLEKYEKDIINMEGFGEKSYNNIIDSINKSRKTNLVRVIYAMGIPGIGLANTKLIVRHFGEDLEKLKNASKEELTDIDQMGEVLAGEVYEFFHNDNKMRQMYELLSELEIRKTIKNESNIFSEKIFVITGSLNNFGNRKELQEKIEELGGKCATSVSSKTSYLINNDITSNSSKNKKAKELGVPIITEDDFLDMIK